MSNQFNVGTLTDLAHSISGVGNNFNGAQPEGVVSTTPSRITWAPGTNQGLISPTQLGLTVPIRIVSLRLNMAGQATFSVNLLDGATTTVLSSGTTATSFVDEALTFLSPGQSLQVVTTGAGTSSVQMVCTVIDAAAYVPSSRGH